MANPGESFRLNYLWAFHSSRLLIPGKEFGLWDLMRRCMRGIVKGELVLQSPCEDADCQTQVRDHPKDMKCPAFSQKMHSHLIQIEVMTKKPPQVARDKRTTGDLL